MPRPLAPDRYWAARLNPSVAAFFIFVALIICEVRSCRWVVCMLLHIRCCCATGAPTATSE